MAALSMYFVPLNYTLTSGEDADFHVIYIFYHIFLNAKEKKNIRKLGSPESMTM